MRKAILFTLLACASHSPQPSPHKQLAAPAAPAPPDVMPVLDAAVTPPLGERGGACRTVACNPGLQCTTALPGGYCASACGVGKAACDGACVETRDGELCAKSCTSDRDCRTDEAYVCDPQWRACLVPNFAAIVAKQCPTQTPPRDMSFGDSELVTGGTIRSGVAAVITDQGSVVARVDARLARDRKGTLYAVARDDKQISVTTSIDRGTTWSAPTVAHDPGDCGEIECGADPLIVFGVDPKTRGEVLYTLYGAGANGLRVRSSRDGGKTFVTGALAVAGTRGTAATSADGRLHVVAMLGGPLGAYGSAQQRIEYAISRDSGATFTPPITISGRDEMLPYLFSNPTLAVDDRRKWIYVAYARGGRDTAWDIVIAASKDNGATWKRTKLAGDGCAMHMVPNLAVDPATGTLHVAYYDSAGAPGRFVHASCGPGVTKCKILGAINSTPFAALPLGGQTSKWVGEFESLLVDGLCPDRMEQPALVVDERGQPTTRIFHASAKLAKR